MNRGSRLARWRLVELGAVTAVSEAVLLREGMTAFAGSELAWSLVLTAWLLGVSAGSRLGSGERTRGLGAWLSPSVVVLAALGVVLLRALPALAGASAGETAPGWSALWVWPLAVLPPALAGGLAFPLLARAPGPAAPGRAYALEAAGACAGGLAFSFVLAPWGSAPALCVTAGLAASLRMRRRPLPAVAAALAGVALSWPVAAGLEELGWHSAGHPGKLLAWTATRQQRLELAGGPPLSLYADGRLVASYPDPWQTGVRGHLLMLLHPDPRRVLALGAVADGTVEVLLRHPVARLDLVEEDPRLLEVLPSWYGERMASALADPRVHRLGVDPLRAVRRGGPWDLALLLDPDPASLRRNRTRTVELFSLIARRLSPSGRLVVRTGAGDTYLGGAAGELLATLSSTLKAVFPNVTAVPGEQVLLVAGRRPLGDVASPTALGRRWDARGLRDEVFSADLLPVLLDPMRASALEAFLARTRAPVNRAAEPSAVLPAMALSEGRGSAQLAGAILRLGRLPRRGVLVAAVLTALLLSLVGLTGRRARGEAAAFTIGLASMGTFVILLAAWQSTRGSVYVEIGALTAGFMAGAAAGAALAATLRRPQRTLPLWLAALAGLTLLLAMGLPFALPSAIPLLLAASGALTGAAFPGAAALAGARRPSTAAARGFSADEAGAAAGALLTGILLPAVGVPTLALSLALLLGAGAVSTLRTRS